MTAFRITAAATRKHIPMIIMADGWLEALRFSANARANLGMAASIGMQVCCPQHGWQPATLNGSCDVCEEYAEVYMRIPEGMSMVEYLRLLDEDDRTNDEMSPFWGDIKSYSSKA